MATQIQSSTPTSMTSLSKFIKLPLNREQKNTGTSKKVFSRKPLNISQNSSRLLSSRLKTQQDQDTAEQFNDELKNSNIQLLNQSKNIKFVSTKSSKSLEKLFVSSSVQNLPSLGNLNRKNNDSGVQLNYKINSKNNNPNLSSVFTDNNVLSTSKLEVIYDQQKQDCPTKQNIGSTEFSSNENLYNQEQYDQEFKNPQLKRNHTSSFCYPTQKNFPKDCPQCLINCQKVRDLEEQNRELSNALNSRDSEMKNLSDKIQKLNRILKQTQTFKTNLSYEVKILKEKQALSISQKQEIQSAYKKLQMNFNKLSQEIRYKELEISISKVYKTKSHDLEFKVQNLKKELERAKENMNRLKISKSSDNLRQSMVFGTVKTHKYQRNSPQKKTKQPKLTRVYSEDSVFSLSSQQCD